MTTLELKNFILKISSFKVDSFQYGIINSESTKILSASLNGPIDMVEVGDLNDFKDKFDFTNKKIEDFLTKIKYSNKVEGNFEINSMSKLYHLANSNGIEMSFGFINLHIECKFISMSKLNLKEPLIDTPPLLYDLILINPQINIQLTDTNHINMIERVDLQGISHNFYGPLKISWKK